jgi:serine protease AprX
MFKRNLSPAVGFSFKRIALAVCLMLGCMLANAAAQTATQPGLARLAIAPARADGLFDGVATFGGTMPSAAQLDALKSLGLRVQGFQNLPLALLRGQRQAMFDAVSRGLASDVYPNERLHFDSRASDIAINADQVQAMGIDGRGVGVAIVDSGIDATHPDLAKRVKHNVKIVDPEVVGTQTDPRLIIPVDQTPYSNSDTSSGHGTHVAGIVAGDNTDGKVLGVAPKADLIGFGTGDVVFVFSVLAAYDEMITHRTDWNIRVANNSWGGSFRLFDPNDPINQATKAAYNKGIVVVFSAGNESTEMSINPNSIPSWVVSVGAGGLNHQLADFSSGGIEYDNSTYAAPPAGDEQHVAYMGDRFGIYHPSVSAPGVNIVSTGTTGAAVTSAPGGTATASGTSMASPHVAGLAALLLQKRPTLSPLQVKQVLEVTASLMPSVADSSRVQPFYTAGYGFVDAKAAVALVSRSDFSQTLLTNLLGQANARVMGDRDYKVLRTDFWTFTAAPATVNGVPDEKDYFIGVASTTKAIKALVSYPSLGYVGVNVFDYHITITDAAGKVVAESTASGTSGTSDLFVDLTKGTYKYGTWKVNLRGDLGSQDQGVVMGTRVSMTLAQLTPQTRTSPKLPTFTASGSTTFYFQPGAAGLSSSAEGCNQQEGAPKGGLSKTRGAGACQAGAMGYAVNYGADDPAVYTSAPLAAPVTVGGPMTFTVYLADPAETVWQAGFAPRLAVEVNAVDANGELIRAVASGEFQICDAAGNCKTGPTATRGVYTLNIPGVTLPAGSRLSVVMRESAAVASATHTVYGGKGTSTSYSDAGVKLTTGALR